METSLRPISQIDTVARFSNKARDYARFRRDYPDVAIAAIIDLAGLNSRSVVADIGAGPGMATRHFLGKVARVYAVEPNDEMRGAAIAALGNHAGFVAVAGRAEATTLANGCIDLIVAGRSLHWFDPEPARREFHRILRRKPATGWLAVLRDQRTQEELQQAVRAFCTAENGCRDREDVHHIERVEPGFYFGHEDFQRLQFPGVAEQSWEEFLGDITTRSTTPDPGHPLRPRFEQAARAVFDRFAVGERLVITYDTVVLLGQVSRRQL